MKKAPLLTCVLLMASFFILFPSVSSQSQEKGLTAAGEQAKDSGRLESALAQMVDAYRGQGHMGATALAKQMSVDFADDMVRVVLESIPGASKHVAATAESLGGKIEAINSVLVQALLPLSALEEIAESKTVATVRRPFKPVPSEIVSEGVALSAADLWQAAGTSGTGIKVGIIDGGFAGSQRMLGSELPATITSRSFRADGDFMGGGDTHGTACAEIIHDMAPDAALYLANFDTDVEFANAVDWMISQRVHIISVSNAWFATGPGDGTGPINDAVNKAAASGIFWTSGAGNTARHHWSGEFKDSNANGWQKFSDTEETNGFYTAAGSQIIAWLRWDDPWRASTNDYDLYLYDASMNVVAKSENAQGRGYSYPYEALSYTAPEKGTYYLAIKKSRATRAVKFDLFISHFLQPLTFYVTPGSINEPGDNPNVFTVGAINWRTPSNIEIYSSQGPTTDGRIKPDIAGPTKITTVSYPAGFSGTSGAAPHVAGAAALVKQAYPSFTASQIKTFLAGRAVDMGAPHKDNVFGWGRLNLETAPITPIPTPTLTPTLTPTPTRTPTPAPTATPNRTPTPGSSVTPTRTATAGGSVTPTSTKTPTRYRVVLPLVRKSGE